MSQHRRGSIHTGSPVPGHPATNTSIPPSHEVQTRGIPLPGMVPSRSIHGNPMHGNPIHGFVNPLGPAGLVHSPPTHQSVLSGISHHSPVVHQGIKPVARSAKPCREGRSPVNRYRMIRLERRNDSIDLSSLAILCYFCIIRVLDTVPFYNSKGESIVRSDLFYLLFCSFSSLLLSFHFPFSFLSPLPGESPTYFRTLFELHSERTESCSALTS